MKRFAVGVVVLATPVLLVGQAAGVGIVDEIHIPGFGWVVGEEGVPLDPGNVDKARNIGSMRLSLDERIAQAQKDTAEAASRPPHLAPFEDSGDPEEIERVREAMKRIIAAELEMQIGGEVSDDAREQVVKNYTAATADQVLRELVAGALDDEDDPNLILASAKTTITKWNGVQVDGNRAVALAEGIVETVRESEWERTSRHVYQMMLVKEAGAWKQHFLYDTDLDLG